MSKLFHRCDILLPKPDIDLHKWTVIACDQFTAQPTFWDEVSTIVGEAPSTFHLIFPEAWLTQVDEQAQTKKINETMRQYVQDDLFSVVQDSYIYVKRHLKNGAVRHGIVGAIDLEAYLTEEGSASKLRATERIIPARLPARAEIRKGAVLELPHVLLLIDDPAQDIIEPLAKETTLEKLYDFPLMQDAGHLEGYRLTGSVADTISTKIEALPIVLVGDGNHSLVAAKIAWESIRENLSEQEKQTHPARFALVELGNVHDPSLLIEPIHRIVFDANETLIETLIASSEHVRSGAGEGYPFRYISGDIEGVFTISGLSIGAAIALLQEFIDERASANGWEVDYIHGDNELAALAAENQSLAIFMPPIEKSTLFTSVLQSGVFPKKSFSMGDGIDKRHYLECKIIQE